MAKIASEMAKTDAKPAISVVSAATLQGNEPPRPLGTHGLALWQAIQAEYRIQDSGGCEILAQLCASADRAEQLAEAIDRDGVLIPANKDGTGLKAHPAVREELACRSFVVRSLERLGISISVVPTRPPGRPPKSYGW
jgi:hypothetical protein